MELGDIEYTIDEELENELVYSILEEALKKADKKTLNTKSKPKRRKISSKKKRKGEIKIRTILLLLFTLLANTYAWFIYNTTISSKLDVHIKSWEFELEAGDNVEDFIFTVEEIYPGMPDETSTIEAHNKGETDAKLTCNIKHIKILDEDFYAPPELDADRVQGITYYTPQQLLDKLLNDYPFKIEIYINGTLYTGTDDVIIAANSPTTTIQYKVSWPYETGTGDEIVANDAIDTEWGERAYEYYHDEENEGEHYCIEVELTVKATQVSTSSTTTPETPESP